MRVLLVNDFFAPLQPGGAEVHVSDLAAGLAGRGHVVGVATARVRGLSPKEEAGRFTIFRIGRFPPKSTSYRISSGSAPASLARETRADLLDLLDFFQPDVVHFHNPWVLGPAILSVPAVRKGVTFHDYWAFCPKRTLMRVSWTVCPGPAFLACRLCRLRAPSGWKNLDLISLERERKERRLLLGQCDFLISPSRYVADRIQEHVGLQPRLIHHGIPVRPPLQASEPVPGSVLFVGRASREKGYPVLLEAMKNRQLAGCRLLVAGNPPSRMPKDGTALGWLNHAEVLAWMARVDCVVVPSLWPEPAALVLLETMQAGTPLVGSLSGGNPDYVVDGRTGLLVEPGNANQLADAIRICVEDADFRKRVKQEAGHLYEERFTFGRMLDQVEAAYAA